MKHLSNQYILEPKFSIIDYNEDFEAYTANDLIGYAWFADLNDAQELEMATQTAERINAFFRQQQAWLRDTGFFQTDFNEASMLAEHLPCVLMFNENREITSIMPAFAYFTLKMDILIPVQHNGAVYIAARNKQYQQFIQKVFDLAVKTNDFNPLLLSNLEYRLIARQANKTHPNISLKRQCDLFRVQQILYLFLSTDNNEICEVLNATLDTKGKEQIYIDYIKQFDNYDAIIGYQLLSGVLAEKSKDGRYSKATLPVYNNNQERVFFEEFASVVKQLPEVLQKRCWVVMLHRILTAKKMIIDQIDYRPIVQVNAQLQDFIKYGQSVLRDVDNNKFTPALKKSYGNKLALDLSDAQNILLTHRQNNYLDRSLQFFDYIYMVFNNLEQAITKMFFEEKYNKLGVGFSCNLFYRMSVVVHYLPQAELFSKMAYKKLGKSSVIWLFDDSLEKVFDFLNKEFEAREIDITLSEMQNVFEIIEDVRKADTQNLAEKEFKNIVDIFRFLFNESNDYHEKAAMFFKTRLNRKDLRTDLGFPKPVMLFGNIEKSDLTLYGNHVLFFAGTPYSANQLKQVQKAVDVWAQNNPMFLWQTSVPIDCYDKVYLDQLDQVLTDISMETKENKKTPVFKSYSGAVKLAGFFQSALINNHKLTTDYTDGQLNNYVSVTIGENKSVLLKVNHFPLGANALLSELSRTKESLSSNIKQSIVLHYGLNGEYIKRKEKLMSQPRPDSEFLAGLVESAGAGFLKDVYLYHETLSEIKATTNNHVVLNNIKQAMTVSKYLLYGCLPIKVFYHIQDKDVSNKKIIQKDLEVLPNGLPELYLEQNIQVMIAAPFLLPMPSMINDTVIWRVITTGDCKDTNVLMTTAELEQKLKAYSAGHSTIKLDDLPDLLVYLDNEQRHKNTKWLQEQTNFVNKANFVEMFSPLFDRYAELNEQLLLLPETAIKDQLGTPLFDLKV